MGSTHWRPPAARITKAPLISGAYSLGRLEAAVFIDVDVQNMRVYVRGRRLHHGLIGAVAIAAGLVAAVHDRRDVRVWVRDFVRKG
ncbi:hypothetical protein UFOVP952_4 [uncultured Caudovirales phage]|uniref:Uncharacterized protein n=1 Tax=uncultured Caudovirales phage TaxID=2100421 RepID=A0A6J5PRT4_9CAUD|nr:hypothetical protein UFOVP952_4 [uncultured Caudovirales phage]CAB4204321.1 hypothetical protein UFOVP1392_49 [uncultured Caudovirales phage]CAB5230229.1 hypothetical protein UFOVP1569_48 [uncultured Caudovirales phage]